MEVGSRGPTLSQVPQRVKSVVPQLVYVLETTRRAPEVLCGLCPILKDGDLIGLGSGD